MEAFIYMGMLLGVFAMGVALGGLIENKRLAMWYLSERVEHIEGSMQRISDTLSRMETLEAAPMAEEVGGGTLVDYEWEDPEVTQDLPIIKAINT